MIRSGRGDAELSSLFLGPKGENADAFERLLLEAFRDHVFWRRNFHPEDGFTISEAQRRSPAHQEALSELSEALMGLLGELKGGVPFFSPRHIGHMTSDLTMASLAGYFATMLYNPNNVAAEASPVTTRLEFEVSAELARMIGFPAEGHWSHLTSGGTVANFEALALARQLKYLPVALRWASEELRVPAKVTLPGGDTAQLGDLELWELLNLTPAEALDAADRFRAAVGDAHRAHEALQRGSLTGLGFQDFGRRLETDFEKTLPPAVVLVPSTAHYSWEKLCRALGIGASHLLRIPVDAHFRMDPAALEERLLALAERRQSVIAVVTVAGTTEEAAVDRIDLVADVRDRVARAHGMTFTLHADAAWGGYAASVTRGRDGQRRSFEAARAEYAPDAWPDEGVFRALGALERVDSVTIDPHKLGFIPYPAGAICVRDGRSRELVTVEAPYAFEAEARADLGRYIFEGSKPGAAAAAVWMSHRVLPLHAGGYGRLIAETGRGARKLHRALAGADWGPLSIVLLPPSDLNIVCFAFGHPGVKTLEANNAWTQRIHQAMSLSGRRRTRQLDYLVSRTVLRASEYGDAVLPLVAKLGFDAPAYQAAGGLTVLRCTVMDPFVADGAGKVDFLGGFVDALRSTAEAVRSTAGLDARPR